MESITLWIKEDTRLSKDSLSIQSKIKAILLTLDQTDVLTEYKKIDRSYHENLNVMKRKLGNLRKKVASLKDNIVHYVTDGTDIQKMLENLEESLTAFKRTMRSEYDQLQIDEKILTEESKSYDEMIVEYENRREMANDNENNDNSDNNMKPTEKSRMDYISNLDKDITNKAVIGGIDRQLTTLGKLGGWDYRDHDVFLKVWTQLAIEVKSYLVIINSETVDESSVSPRLITINNISMETKTEDEKKKESFIVLNRSTLVRKLVKLLPGISLADIEDHVDWYVQVIKLQEIKKSLLHEWKLVRQREVLGKMERELVVEVLKSNGENEINGNNVVQNLVEEEERKRTKQRVEAWKKQRQEEEERKRKEEKLKEEQEIRRKEEEKRERLEVSKFHLRKWKEEETRVKAQEEVEKRRLQRPVSADPAEIMRRRQRNVELGKERFSKVTQKAQEPLNRRNKQKAMEDEIVNNLFSKIKRDSTRLQSVTKATAAQQISREYLDDATDRRLHASAHSKPIALSGRDLRIGVRAIPLWRKPPG